MRESMKRFGRSTPPAAAYQTLAALSQRASGGQSESGATGGSSGSGETGGESGAGGSDPDSTSASTERADELPLDQVFEILKNSRRRLTLHYLDENGGSTSLSDLAEHIAAIENDTSVDAISSSQRKRVYVGLYQCHLPKMDDMDIVEFDRNRGTIERGRNAAQLKPYIEESDEPAWHRLYATVAVAGIGLFGVSALGGSPLGLTPAAALAAVLAATALCALGHTVAERRT